MVLNYTAEMIKFIFKRKVNELFKRSKILPILTLNW